MIRGAGLPSFRHHDMGNMYVIFDIEFPSQVPSLDESQKDTLKHILGVPIKTPQEKQAIAAHKASKDPNSMAIDQDTDLEVDALTSEIPPGAQEDEFDLEDVDHTGQQRARMAHMEDEDEDGMPQGAERMQCASQ